MININDKKLQKQILFWTSCSSTVLWFNFILGLNCIFDVFWYGICVTMISKQKKIKFKPRIKLNQNIHIQHLYNNRSLPLCKTEFLKMTHPFLLQCKANL